MKVKNIFNKLKDILFYDKYSKENIDKKLHSIELESMLKGITKIEILHLQRKYLDKVDAELDEQLKYYI